MTCFSTLLLASGLACALLLCQAMASVPPSLPQVISVTSEPGSDRAAVLQRDCAGATVGPGRLPGSELLLLFNCVASPGLHFLRPATPEAMDYTYVTTANAGAMATLRAVPVSDNRLLLLWAAAGSLEQHLHALVCDLQTMDCEEAGNCLASITWRAGFALGANSQTVMLVGGQNRTGGLLQDAWYISIPARGGAWDCQLQNYGSMPAARRDAALMLERGKATLMGGVGASGPLDDVWTRSTQMVFPTWTPQRSSAAPMPGPCSLVSTEGGWIFSACSAAAAAATCNSDALWQLAHPGNSSAPWHSLPSLPKPGAVLGVQVAGISALYAQPSLGGSTAVAAERWRLAFAPVASAWTWDGTNADLQVAPHATLGAVGEGFALWATAGSAAGPAWVTDTWAGRSAGIPALPSSCTALLALGAAASTASALCASNDPTTLHMQHIEPLAYNATAPPWMNGVSWDAGNVVQCAAIAVAPSSGAAVVLGKPTASSTAMAWWAAPDAATAIATPVDLPAVACTRCSRAACRPAFALAADASSIWLASPGNATVLAWVGSQPGKSMTWQPRPCQVNTPGAACPGPADGVSVAARNGTAWIAASQATGEPALVWAVPAQGGSWTRYTALAGPLVPSLHAMQLWALPHHGTALLALPAAASSSALLGVLEPQQGSSQLEWNELRPSAGHSLFAGAGSQAVLTSQALWLAASNACPANASDRPVSGATTTLWTSQVAVSQAAPLAPDLLWAMVQLDCPVAAWSQVVAAGDDLVWFGGLMSNGSTTDATWLLSTRSLTWTALAGSTNRPPARVDHTLTAVLGSVVLFGGRTCAQPGCAALGDTWMLSARTNIWSKVTSTTGITPTAKFGAAAAPLQNRYVVVFGGSPAPGEVTAECSVLDTREKDWQVFSSSFGAAPAARWLHAMASTDSLLWVYGGFDAAGQALDDLWMLRFGTVQWIQVHMSSYSFQLPTGLGMAAFAASSSTLWIAGGAQSGTQSNSPLQCQSYVWNSTSGGSTWQQMRVVTAPDPATAVRFIVGVSSEWSSATDAAWPVDLLSPLQVSNRMQLFTVPAQPANLASAAGWLLPDLHWIDCPEETAIPQLQARAHGTSGTWLYLTWECQNQPGSALVRIAGSPALRVAWAASASAPAQHPSLFIQGQDVWLLGGCSSTLGCHANVLPQLLHASAPTAQGAAIQWTAHEAACAGENRPACARVGAATAVHGEVVWVFGGDVPLAQSMELLALNTTSGAWLNCTQGHSMVTTEESTAQVVGLTAQGVWMATLWEQGDWLTLVQAPRHLCAWVPGRVTTCLPSQAWVEYDIVSNTGIAGWPNAQLAMQQLSDSAQVMVVAYAQPGQATPTIEQVVLAPGARPATPADGAHWLAMACSLPTDMCTSMLMDQVLLTSFSSSTVCLAYIAWACNWARIARGTSGKPELDAKAVAACAGDPASVQALLEGAPSNAPASTSTTAPYLPGAPPGVNDDDFTHHFDWNNLDWLSVTWAWTPRMCVPALTLDGSLRTCTSWGKYSPQPYSPFLSDKVLVACDYSITLNQACMVFTSAAGWGRASQLTLQHMLIADFRSFLAPGMGTETGSAVEAGLLVPAVIVTNGAYVRLRKVHAQLSMASSGILVSNSSTLDLDDCLLNSRASFGFGSVVHVTAKDFVSSITQDRAFPQNLTYYDFNPAYIQAALEQAQSLVAHDAGPLLQPSKLLISGGLATTYGSACRGGALYIGNTTTLEVHAELLLQQPSAVTRGPQNGPMKAHVLSGAPATCGLGGGLYVETGGGIVMAGNGSLQIMAASAEAAGGAVYCEQPAPCQDLAANSRVQFSSQATIFGPNMATNTQQVLISSEWDQGWLQWANGVEIPAVPGSSKPANLLLQVLDGFHQGMSGDVFGEWQFQLSVQVPPGEHPACMLWTTMITLGNVSHQSGNWTTSLQVSGLPGTRCKVQAQLTGPGVPVSLQLPTITVSMSDCLPGHVLTAAAVGNSSNAQALAGTSCTACPFGSFSVSPSSTFRDTCYTCPVDGTCIGGYAVNMVSGYWAAPGLFGLPAQRSSISPIQPSTCAPGWCGQGHTSPVNRNASAVRWVQTCAAGRDPTSKLCGQCLPGRRNVVASSTCSGLCYPTWLAVLLMLLGLAAYCLFILGYVTDLFALIGGRLLQLLSACMQRVSCGWYQRCCGHISSARRKAAAAASSTLAAARLHMPLLQSPDGAAAAATQEAASDASSLASDEPDDAPVAAVSSATEFSAVLMLIGTNFVQLLNPILSGTAVNSLGTAAKQLLSLLAGLTVADITAARHSDGEQAAAPDSSSGSSSQHQLCWPEDWPAVGVISAGYWLPLCAAAALALSQACVTARRRSARRRAMLHTGPQCVSRKQLQRSGPAQGPQTGQPRAGQVESPPGKPQTSPIPGPKQSEDTLLSQIAQRMARIPSPQEYALGWSRLGLFMYAHFVSVTLQFLDCERVAGHSVLVHAPSVECSTGLVLTFSAVLALLLLWPLALLLGMLPTTRRSGLGKLAAKFAPPSLRATLGVGNAPGAGWWNAAALLHRIATVVVAALLANSLVWRQLLLVSLAVVALVCNSMTEPWEARWANALDSGLHSVLVLSGTLALPIVALSTYTAALPAALPSLSRAQASMQQLSDGLTFTLYTLLVAVCVVAVAYAGKQVLAKR